ncbi:MAG: hypothetical protein J6D54_05180 [Olsenella sp.]|nr:hypothetical protein [Olsenella sp.]
MEHPQSNQNQATRQYGPTRQYESTRQYGPTRQYESTRQYTQQGEVGTTMRSNAAEQETPAKKEGVFSEFSVVSVIASSLAAITSFALQQQIGLAGSFIGVGAAAAATAIANQVYNGMLSASAKKLKSISEEDATAPAAGTRASGAETRVAGGAYAQEPSPYGASADKTTLRPVTATYAADQGVMPESGTPIAPEGLVRAAAERRHALIRRRATISIVVIALAAALLSAGIVFLATGGHGLGRIDSLTTASPKPTPTTSTPTTAQRDDEASPTENGTTAPEGETSADATAAEQGSSNNGTSASGTGGGESSGSKVDGSSSAGTSGSSTGTTEKPSTGTSGGATGTGNGTGSQEGGSTSDSSAGGASGTGSGSTGSGSTGSGSTGSGSTGSGNGTGGNSAGSTSSSSTTTTNKS